MTADSNTVFARDETAPWITLHGQGPTVTQPRAECGRCGEKQELALPMAVTPFVKATMAFMRRHRKCVDRSDKA